MRIINDRTAAVTRLGTSLVVVFLGATAACVEGNQPLTAAERMTLDALAPQCADGGSDVVRIVGYSPFVLHDTPMSPRDFEAGLVVAPPDYEITLRHRTDMARLASVFSSTAGYAADGTIPVDVHYRAQCLNNGTERARIYGDFQGNVIVNHVAFACEKGDWLSEYLRRADVVAFEAGAD